MVKKTNKTPKQESCETLDLSMFRVEPIGRVASDVNLGIRIVLVKSDKKSEVDFYLQSRDAAELVRQLSNAIAVIK